MNCSVLGKNTLLCWLLSIVCMPALAAPTTLVFSSDGGAAWSDGVAEDGEGGAVDIPGITIQIRNIDDAAGTSLGSISWQDNSFLASNDSSYSGLTYNNNDGSKGMSIASSNGDEFGINGFRYYNWGETDSTTITVKGYRDGMEVASTSYEGASPPVHGPDIYAPINVTLNPPFDAVDEVRLYISAGGYWGDQSATNHSINNIVIDSSVVSNSAPVVDANGPVGGTTHSTTFTENGSAVRITASDATLSDDGNVTNMTLTLAATPDGASEIIAYSAVLNSGASLASLGLTGSYNGGTRTYSVSGVASPAVYQAVLRAMVYNNSSNSPGTMARTVVIVVTDAEAATGQATATINITAVNDAPAATNLTQVKLATEGGGAVALDDIVVTDPDAGETVTATLLLSDPAAGSLSTGTYGSATSTFNAGTGMWTVTGSVSDVNAALAAVSFIPSADNDQDFTITTRIRDAADTGPADGTITVTVTGVNDPPTGIALSNASLLESAAAAGADIGVLSTADIDNTTFTYSLVGVGAGGAGVCASDSGNTSFQINGSTLEAASALAAGSYNVCVQTFDGEAAYKKGFVITVSDDVAPAVSSVSVPANGTYAVGAALSFTVNTTENVIVTGSPSLPLIIGTTTRQASYAPGPDSSALVFSYTVQAGDVDVNGISVGSTISLNGGALRDAANNDMALMLNAVGSTASVLVDAVAPSGHSVSFDDDVIGGSDASAVSFTFASAEVGADYSFTISSSGGGTTVTGSGIIASATDQISGIVASGLADGTLTLSVTLTDAAGNIAGAVTDTATLDAAGPAASIMVSDSELTQTETSLVTITFNEVVTGFTNDDLTVENGSLSPVSSADGGITWTAILTPATDTYEPDNVITLSNAGVADSAGNPGSGTTTSNNYIVRTRSMTLLVTSALDTGDDETLAATMEEDAADGNGLSLREAIFWARSQDSITFDLDSGTAGNQGGTITLGGSQLIIDKTITIDGDLDDDNVPDITLSGNNASRIFMINSGVAGVHLMGLTLTEGLATLGGGGGGALAIYNNSAVVIRDSVFTNNTSVDSGITGGAGAIYGIQADVSIINTTISNNTANFYGGAIRVIGTGSVLNMVNSTVSGNSTSEGNGGAIHFGGTGVTLTNVTISGNQATGPSSRNGAMEVGAGFLAAYNSTIVGNAATVASGGINVLTGMTTLVNTVVAGNRAGADAASGTDGSALATGGVLSDVGNTVTTAINSFFSSNVVITSNTSSYSDQGTSNLMLAVLAYNNNGRVQTHRPQAGSLLQEAGSDQNLPADIYDLDGDNDMAEALPVDANGDQRVRGTVDIGAVEANLPPVLTVNDSGTYVEGGSAVVIDSNATVSDGDMDSFNGSTGNYDGASLVIVRTGGAVATDILGFVEGSYVLSSGEILKAGQSIASFDTSVAGQLTIRFTDANGQRPATADVRAILRQITYSTTDEDPDASISLEWTFSDGIDSVTDTGIFAITPVNDIPTITGTPPGSVVAGTPYLFVPVLHDLEGDVLTVTASNLPAWASLDAATGTVSGTPGNIDAGTATDIVLTVSDGEDSASLPAFAIEVVFDGTLDSDNDGIPDGVELANGLNPFDPADALEDADGDGVSNLDEYLADSDMLADDYGPVFPVLDTLSINATGLLTPRPVLDAPVALDGLDGPITATLVPGSEWLAPGSHTLTWAAEDAAGNRTEVQQSLHVYPLISLGVDQVRGEGAVAAIRVLLNGPAPVYPFTVGFTLDGTADASDHDLAVTSVTFNQDDVEQQVVFTLIDDGVPEGGEILRASLDVGGTSPDSADFGARRAQAIHIVEENVAPLLAFQLQQNGEPRRIVTRDGGPVQVAALFDDPNPGDGHTYAWQLPGGLMPATGASATFDPALLEPGVHAITLTVTDDGLTPLSTRDSVSFLVRESAPVLGAEDSDSDGIDDATEGFADSDGDGQPDYLDAITLSSVINETAEDDGRFLAEGEPGLRLELGAWSLLDGADGILVSRDALTAAGVPEDVMPNEQGYFDVVVRGLQAAGTGVNVVLPLRQPLPESPVYRLHVQGGWVNFLENAHNQLASAPGANGVCPPPGSDEYTAGLTPEHWCVQLIIEDGGPNDADGEVNGSVVNTGGVGAGQSYRVRVGSDGGALGLSALVLCLLLARTRRRRVGVRR